MWLAWVIDGILVILCGHCILQAQGAVASAQTASALSKRILDDWQADAAKRDISLHQLIALVERSVTPKTVPIEKREPDPITQAITAIAGNNMKLRALMSRQAMQDQKSGLSVEQIVGAIYAGITSEDGIPA